MVSASGIALYLKIYRFIIFRSPDIHTAETSSDQATDENTKKDLDTFVQDLEMKDMSFSNHLASDCFAFCHWRCKCESAIHVIKNKERKCYHHETKDLQIESLEGRNNCTKYIYANSRC